MGAPTWPPDPSKAFELTADEYDVDPEAIGAEAEEDEEVEQALLSAFLFRSPDRQLVAGEQNGLTLGEIQRSLHAWLRMLTGRDFALAASDPAATDGQDIFLPRAVPAPREPTDELLYRVMGLVQLGTIHFGVLESPRLLVDIYRDWVLRSCFHLLATRWVLRQWSERFPGVARDLAALQPLDKAGLMRVNLTVVPREGMPAPFRPLYDGLTTCFNWGPPGEEGEPARQAVDAVDRIEDPRAALAVIGGQAWRLRRVYRRFRLGPPPIPYFAGFLRPEWILARHEHDPEYENAWRRGNAPLRQLEAARKRARPPGAPGSPSPGPDSEPAPAEPTGAGPSRRARLRHLVQRGIRRALQGRGDARGLAESPAYGVLRDEHQKRLHEESERDQQGFSPDRPPEELLEESPESAPGEEEGVAYDEWDHERGIYRVAATRVLEPEAPRGVIEGYERIVEANQRAIALVRRRFEALRVEERWLHGQPDGTEIDLDRAITAVTDVAAGQTPDPRIYKRFQRQRQEVAILTLVDLSGSTQGRVIHLEQEAIVLFAEGLRTLAFPHAFYGFHNHDPHACLMERLKGFDEPYGDTVYRRLGNLRPAGATRMGAFLRHAAALLDRTAQDRRILLVLSDGRPEDRGEYRGRYGLRDTAMAVQEARRRNVHVFCISMDPLDDAPDYLERLFGRSGFLALRDVDQLPQRLPEVFRNLIR